MLFLELWHLFNEDKRPIKIHACCCGTEFPPWHNNTFTQSWRPEATALWINVEAAFPPSKITEPIKFVTRGCMIIITLANWQPPRKLPNVGFRARLCSISRCVSCVLTLGSRGFSFITYPAKWQAWCLWIHGKKKKKTFQAEHWAEENRKGSIKRLCIKSTWE